MKRKSLRTILMIILAVYIFSHFFQPSLNIGPAAGPNDITHTVNVSPEVQKVLQRSCYDCHSDSTTYLWYDYIVPANWWIDDHIKEGKRELNFTVFNQYTDRKKKKKLEETVEQIEKGEMPLKSYTTMHPEAKLSDTDKALLIQWAKDAVQKMEN